MVFKVSDQKTFYNNLFVNSFKNEVSSHFMLINMRKINPQIFCSEDYFPIIACLNGFLNKQDE